MTECRRRWGIPWVVLWALGVHPAHAQSNLPTVREQSQPVCSDRLLARWRGRSAVPYRIYEPHETVSVRAEFLFLLGFADRIENHHQFFLRLAKAGIRTLVPAYPSHGEAPNSVSLGSFTIPSLVKREIFPLLMRESIRRVPLFVGGWSTGATIAEYIMRDHHLQMQLGQTPRALVQIAPGLPVRPLPGKWGRVTADTLSREPTLGTWDGVPIRPASPYLHPLFAASLWFRSHALQFDYGSAAKFPRLCFLTSNQDRYVDTDATRRWLLGLMQMTEGQAWVIEFRDAPHAVQWEEKYREDVESTIEAFILRMAVRPHSYTYSFTPRLGGPGFYDRTH